LAFEELELGAVGWTWGPALRIGAFSRQSPLGNPVSERIAHKIVSSYKAERSHHRVFGGIWRGMVRKQNRKRGGNILKFRITAKTGGNWKIVKRGCKSFRSSINKK